MPRSRWSIALCSVGVSLLAGCPFGGSSGDDEGEGPMVIGPGAAGEGGGGEGQGSAGSGATAGGGAAGTGEAGSTGAAAGSSPGAGSGGEEPDGGAGMPAQVPLDELPEAFADAICGGLLDCVGPSKLRELAEREDCEAAIAAELRAKDFAYMDEAIAAGHVLYDPAQLAACAEGIRALGCDVLTSTFPEPCVQVLEGNVDIGGECTITAECKGTAFCTSGASCPSTCQALLPPDAECDADGQCADGLTCLGGRCGALAGDGDACAGSTGIPCELGLSCVGSTDTVAGVCEPNAEVQAGDEGESCEPGGILCQEGLSCVFDGASAFHCEAAVASGEACHLGLPGQCPADEYCDTTEITEAGVCKQLPADGEPCVLTDLCLGGLTCVAEGMNATCRAIGDNGASCSADAACRSGRCEGGRCEPPVACL